MMIKGRIVRQTGARCGFLVLFIILCSSFAKPVKYNSRTGHVHIESANRFMDVIADNYQVYSELNPSTGELKFTGLMKSFEFKLGAIDRAFNSDYVDLSGYNKFRFEGKLTNITEVDFGKPGSYMAHVKGHLIIGEHKRHTQATGLIYVLESGQIKAEADFAIRIEEASMNKINELLRSKLPDVVALDTHKLGISRDIELKYVANYRPRGTK